MHLLYSIIMNNYGYSLALPPRPVPWPVRGQVLFGGIFNQFGWIFFGFGMIFVWLFGAAADFSPVYFALANTETTQGTISDVQSTSASVNDTPVYANHFIFRVEQEEVEYRGVSYTTGQQYSVGQSVPVEYLGSSPNTARIQDTRGGMFDWWVLCLVGIFPVVGLVFIIVGIGSGLKGNQLLAQGKITRGQLISKEPTNTRINNRTVYKLTFEFVADDGLRYEAVAKSHMPHNLEDEEFEEILYLPHTPSTAVLTDNLPGSPEIDEMGTIHPTNVGRSLRPLILPGLVLMVHGTIFLYMIF